MLIGCPKEIKVREYRVGMTPTVAREAIGRGHSVIVETGAGAGSGFPDADYRGVGAEVVDDRRRGLHPRRHDREGQGAAGGERARLREDQILFTYLHLAPDREQTRDLSGAA